MELITLINSMLDTTNKVTSLISWFRATRTTNQAKLNAIIVETETQIRVAKSKGASRIVTCNLEEVARTQRLIDSYVYDGALHGDSLVDAYEQLEELNITLRDNLRRYRDEVIGG